MMCNIDNKDKNNLYNQFVYVRENPMGKIGIGVSVGKGLGQGLGQGLGLG